MKKLFKLGEAARKDIKKVAEEIGSIVGNTLGPSGRNYFISQGITNDGATILNEIRYEDECQDLASIAFGEITARIDKEAGDGTSTGTVIGTQLYLDVV